MAGGGGRRWREEQREVLDHAKGLGYDRDGGSIIEETDDKSAWEKWRDGFTSWKSKNVALEKEGNAFWQQPVREESSMARAPVASAPALSSIQQNAAVNRNFPMLISPYTPPQAFDYSAYTSMSPFGGMGGLLYQPGTQQYAEAFPMDNNLLTYQPPELGFPQVSYSNPITLGIMEESRESNKSPDKKKKKDDDDDYDWFTDPDGRKGGKMEGDVGYGTSTPEGEISMSDISGFFGGLFGGNNDVGNDPSASEGGSDDNPSP